MPDSGSGTVTQIPLSPSTATGKCPNYPKTHYSIEEYWEFLQINENVGYGIRNFPNPTAVPIEDYGCNRYWNYRNRYWLLSSLQKAENRLLNDQYLGFPVRRQYYSDTQRPYEMPVYLGKYVRGLGVEKETLVGAVNLTLSNGATIYDPVTFDINVTFANKDELIIKYPGCDDCSSYWIRPSCVSISGGVASVSIPRARLLKGDYHVDYKNDNERPDYQDDDNFLSTVNVYRNYLDQTTGNNLVWWPKGVCCNTGLSCNCGSSAPCSDTKQLACGYIRSQRDGYVEFRPSTYNATTDSWVNSAALVCRKPDSLELNYMRGFYDRYDVISMDLQRALVALAHNNLPENYCACDVQTLYWQNDNKPFEPPVRMKWGKSTYGVYEAMMIVDQFDKDKNSHKGGML